MDILKGYILTRVNHLPLVLEAASPKNIAELVVKCVLGVENKVNKFGVLLFRGFGVKSLDKYCELVCALSKNRKGICIVLRLMHW